MADKAISELVAAEQIKSTDMFVLEQDGTAKRLQGQTLLNWLTAAVRISLWTPTPLRWPTLPRKPLP